jgi:predicted metal-binding protein
MYTTSRHEATISVPEYLERFVDVPTFLEACKACPNYDRVWSCPSYDFDVLKYWNRYKTFQLLATKITFDEEILSKTYTAEEQKKLLDDVLPPEKQKLSDELLRAEKLNPGSISLSAGSCHLCSQCTKPTGRSCLNPDMMRYSIESLGGNVGLTIEKLLGLNLEWMEEGKLPHHFVLVCGLLLP